MRYLSAALLASTALALTATTALAQPAPTTTTTITTAPSTTMLAVPVTLQHPAYLPAPVQSTANGPAGNPPPSGPHGGPLFDEMDTNHDGIITREEFMAKAAEHFNQIDRNHDGKITPDEGDAAQADMVQKWQQHRNEWEDKLKANGTVLPQPGSMAPMGGAGQMTMPNGQPAPAGMPAPMGITRPLPMTPAGQPTAPASGY